VFESTSNHTYLVLNTGCNATNESVATCVWFRLLGKLLAPSAGKEMKGPGAFASFYSYYSARPNTVHGVKFKT